MISKANKNKLLFDCSLSQGFFILENNKKVGFYKGIKKFKREKRKILIYRVY